MWMDELKIYPGDTGYIREKLVDEKSHLTLANIHSGVLWKIGGNRTGKTEEDRSLTLSYLLPLLKEGKLKARRQILETIPLTAEEIARNVTGHYKVSGYAVFKTAEESIEDIRAVWQSNAYSNFENTVEFILPENLWPIFSPISK